MVCLGEKPISTQEVPTCFYGIALPTLNLFVTILVRHVSNRLPFLGSLTGDYDPGDPKDAEKYPGVNRPYFMIKIGRNQGYDRN